MRLKGAKFLQDLGIFLGKFQLSRPLCGEQGQTEDLAEGRVDGPRSVGAQSCGLAGSAGRSGGEGRLSSGPLGQLLLIVIVILLGVIIVCRKSHFLGAA